MALSWSAICGAILHFAELASIYSGAFALYRCHRRQEIGPAGLISLNPWTTVAPTRCGCTVTCTVACGVLPDGAVPDDPLAFPILHIRARWSLIESYAGVRKIAQARVGPPSGEGPLRR